VRLRRSGTTSATEGYLRLRAPGPPACASSVPGPASGRSNDRPHPLDRPRPPRPNPPAANARGAPPQVAGAQQAAGVSVVSSVLTVAVLRSHGGVHETARAAAVSGSVPGRNALGKKPLPSQERRAGRRRPAASFSRRHAKAVGPEGLPLGIELRREDVAGRGTAVWYLRANAGMARRAPPVVQIRRRERDRAPFDTCASCCLSSCRLAPWQMPAKKNREDMQDAPLASGKYAGLQPSDL